MKISLIQIHSNDDKEANFKKAQKYILEAVKQKPDIISLSENFMYRGKDVKKEPEELSSNYIAVFRELAKENKVNIILGSIVLTTETEKYTNSSLIINRKGEIVYRYDKIYMYDIEKDDVFYRESDKIMVGNKIGFFELEGVKMGVGICVDLRYPEYFRELTKLGAEIIFLPSNFRKVTGQLAWDVLSKARAIENQVYFCACDQTGGIGNLKRCGHTRILSYEGKIISELGMREGIITAELNFDNLRKFRKEFPVLRQIK